MLSGNQRQTTKLKPTRSGDLTLQRVKDREEGEEFKVAVGWLCQAPKGLVVERGGSGQGHGRAAGLQHRPRALHPGGKVGVLGLSILVKQTCSYVCLGFGLLLPQSLFSFLSFHPLLS